MMCLLSHKISDKILQARKSQRRIPLQVSEGTCEPDLGLPASRTVRWYVSKSLGWGTLECSNPRKLIQVGVLGM